MRKHDGGFMALVIAFVGLTSILALVLVDLPTVFYDAELDFVEGFMIYNGISLLKGTAYADGIYVYPYPPLSYLVSALSISITSDCPIVGCRLISLVISLAILILAWIEVGGGLRGLIAPSLIAIAPSFIYWAALCRADQLGVLLSILSVALASRGLLLPSAACAALALFSKQTYVSAPLILIIYMLMRGEKKRAILYVAYVTTIALLLYLPFLIITGGGILLHLVLYNIHDLTVFNLRDLISGAFANGFWAIYLPTFALGLYRARADLYALYYSFSLPFALILSLKIGANTNYFIEPTVIGGILLAREALRSRRAWISIFFCLFIVASLAFFPPTFLLDRVGDPELVMETRSLASTLRKFDEIIAEDAYLATLSGSRMIVEPFIYNQLAARGVIDDVLPEMIRSGIVDAVLIRWGDPTRITSELKALLLAYYNCSETRYFTICVSPKADLESIESDFISEPSEITSLQQIILEYFRLILLVLSWICFTAFFTLSLMFAWWSILENHDNNAGKKSL